MKSILLFPLLLATSVLAQEPDSSSALFKMREAEQNFAKASIMTGRNAAFVENFAEVSVLFTDKWITNGKQYSGERKASPVVLKWEPEFMDIAESRDFGFSTGPWEAQEYRPGTSPISSGYFLTLWKKQPDGKWKVILDGGGETPALKDPKHSFSFPSGADKSVTDPPILDIGIISKKLSDLENEFLLNWEKNPLPSTYISFMTTNSRMQLSGHLPSTNQDTIKTWISHLDKTITWKTSGSGAATSGDMGFTYGLLGKQAKSEVKGHYVRIWKKNQAGNWKITMEMLNFD